MIRTPVPDQPGRPTCYGFRWVETSKVCTVCPFKGACSISTRVWRARRSIAWQLHESEAEIRLERVDKTDIKELYTRLFEQHYGKPPLPYVVSGAKSMKLFARLQVMCEKEAIDPAMWIVARMRAMDTFLTKQRESGGYITEFSPKFLGVGNDPKTRQRAREHYNIEVRLGNQLWHRARADARVGASPAIKLLDEIAEEEERVAGLFVEERWQGEDPVWIDTVSMLPEVDPRWKYLTGLKGLDAAKAGIQLNQQFSEETLHAVITTARLRAAVNISERYRFGLSERITFRAPLSWPDFADLLASLVPYVPKREPTPKRLDGALIWRP